MGGKLWALVIHITYSNRDIYATSMDENTNKSILCNEYYLRLMKQMKEHLSN